MIPSASFPYSPGKVRLRHPLPLMATLEEAQALSEREGDSFYYQAFFVQHWLGQLEAQAAGEYREPKSRRLRVMQTNQAQRGFLQTFGPLGGAAFAELLENLYRFTEHEHRLAGLLFRGLAPLAMEHQSSGDFMEPRMADPSRRPREATTLLWQSLERWCEWLDAVIHLGVHAEWHLSGNAAAAAPEVPASDSPHRTLSQAFLAQANGYWPCQELDETVIALWPLFKRHNWTHGDLLSVLRDLLRRPEVWPCRNEKVLAAYCAENLGLHKLGRGETSKGNRPPGYDVALRLCPPLRQPVPPGEPPWYDAFVTPR